MLKSAITEQHLLVQGTVATHRHQAFHAAAAPAYRATAIRFFEALCIPEIDGLGLPNSVNLPCFLADYNISTEFSPGN
jgi:hypothetical protein